ncbi:hypothetical protein ACMHYB_10400 [Sorangium sp. So ce1128]
MKPTSFTLLAPAEAAMAAGGGRPAIAVGDIFVYQPLGASFRFTWPK